MKNENNNYNNYDEEEIKKEQRKRAIRRIIELIIIIIIIILLLRGCQAVPSTTNIGDNQTPTNGWDLTVDPNSEEGPHEGKTQEEIIEELNNKVAAGMITIHMNTFPVFENGSSKGNLLIENEPKNNYPQIIEIYIKETDQLIYQSKLIPVGSRIDYAPLDVKLAKGEYNCIAYFNAIDTETGQSIGKAGAEIVVTVLN